MAFNPARSFMEGFDSGKQMRISNLVSSLSDKMGDKMMNPSDSEEYQQLMALDPQRAATIRANFENLSNDRKKSYFNYIREAKNLVAERDLEGFLDSASKRLDYVESVDGDTSGIAMLVNKAMSGDLEGLNKGLESAELAGIEGGFLSDPLDRELKQQSLNDRRAGKGKFQKRVQNSRDVEGGTLITYNDGSQEFLPFGDDVRRAALDSKQMNLPELPSGLQSKQLNLQESANTAYALAEKASTLSDEFSKIDTSAGAAGSAREAFLSFVGGQDEISNLRKDYTRIRNKLITANLPQGPATDKDIELIAEGFPPATASQAQIVDFLKAMSRGQEAVAKFDEFQSVFLQENGNITRATRNFTFDGQEIKDGERLRPAYKRISGKLTPKATVTAEISNAPAPLNKSISDMSDEELNAIINGGNQ